MLGCVVALSLVTLIVIGGFGATGGSTRRLSLADDAASTRAIPKAGPSELIATPATRSPSGQAPSAGPAEAAPLTWLLPTAGLQRALATGSQPAALPAPVLIADKYNNRLVVVDSQGRVRWQFPRPGDLPQGQTFEIPDDAFFTPDGSNIIATEEDDAVITVVNVVSHRITYRYGTPGTPGMGANQLDNPDDAIMLADRTILSPDIKNCRLILIKAGTHVPYRIIGTTTHRCWHGPPEHWGSPNGAFPMRNGHYLVTEINGDWINEVALDGRVLWSTHAPRIAYPSDTNEIAPDRYLTVDYSSHGQVIVFDHTGRLLWRYTPLNAAGTLNHPSLARALPNGDILLNDDFNHRVIVIDPHTDRIVWQYGHSGVPGAAPGYLDNPDGLDLVPPGSLLTEGSGH